MSSFYELVPDASNLIESQRSVGYTFETAVADIIDNSVSAAATRIDINFDSQKSMCRYSMMEKECQKVSY